MPTIPADFDHDGDVDSDDMSHLRACLTGESLVQSNPACADARLDGDLDVDLGDLGIAQLCLSGARVAADPTCAD